MHYAEFAEDEVSDVGLSQVIGLPTVAVDRSA